MSIQWTIVASFLYAEIAVVLLLVLPVASPKRWQAIFRSRFVAALNLQVAWYFYVLLLVLVLFLLDAIREMRKYSGFNVSDVVHTPANQLDLETRTNLKLFRAQRNFYISGFSLFLSLVIRRLVILISSLATMEAQSQAALKQAAGASAIAKDYLSHGGIEQQNKSNQAHDEEVTKLESHLSKLKKELEAERCDKEALKKQAESLTKEYDRLSEEYNKLEKKLSLQSSGDKKDN